MQVTFTPQDSYPMWVEFYVELNGQQIKCTWSTADGYGYDIEQVLALIPENERQDFALEFESKLPSPRAVLS